MAYGLCRLTPDVFAAMTVREYRALRAARHDERMEAWGRLGWLAWKIRARWLKPPGETLDAVMGDRWKVWRMAREAERGKGGEK